LPGTSRMLTEPGQVRRHPHSLAVGRPGRRCRTMDAEGSGEPTTEGQARSSALSPMNLSPYWARGRAGRAWILDRLSIRALVFFCRLFRSTGSDDLAQRVAAQRQLRGILRKGLALIEPTLCSRTHFGRQDLRFAASRETFAWRTAPLRITRKDSRSSTASERTWRRMSRPQRDPFSRNRNHSSSGSHPRGRGAVVSGACTRLGSGTIAESDGGTLSTAARFLPLTAEPPCFPGARFGAFAAGRCRLTEALP
jgi:hypothetical protein